MKDLKQGTFLAGYYHGTERGISDVYRIGEVCRDSYIVFSIINQSNGYNLPLCVSFNEVEIKNEYCFQPISYEDVKALIIDIEREDIINSFMSIPHGVSGIKRGEERNHWESVEPHSLARSYTNWIYRNSNNKSKVNVYRILDKGVIVYEPIGEYFNFWGHKKIKLELTT